MCAVPGFAFFTGAEVPPRYPAGGLPSLSPVCPAFCFDFAPLPRRGRISPQPPSPEGKGETFSFLMQGASPLASPGAGRSAALARLALAVPRGERALLVAGSPCRYDAQRGGLPSLPPADAAFSFCFCPLPRGRISGGLIRQAHEKCRLIKIPRGGHTDATAQRGDSRLSCRQCLPRRNRNRVRKQKKHRRNRGN